MANAAVASFLVLVSLVGGVSLRILLSKKNSKQFGPILPAVAFLYSLLMVLGLAVYDGMDGREILTFIASTLLLSSISTIVLLGIYFGCCEKMKLRAEFKKMSIQNLEQLSIKGRMKNPGIYRTPWVYFLGSYTVLQQLTIRLRIEPTAEGHTD